MNKWYILARENDVNISSWPSFDQLLFIWLSQRVALFTELVKLMYQADLFVILSFNSLCALLFFFNVSVIPYEKFKYGQTDGEGNWDILILIYKLSWA